MLSHSKAWGKKGLYGCLIERTFAWLVTYRRLAKDYEELPATGEAFIYLAMSRLMVKRLAHY